MKMRGTLKEDLIKALEGLDMSIQLNSKELLKCNKLSAIQAYKNTLANLNKEREVVSKKLSKYT